MNVADPMFEPTENKWAVHQGETTETEYRRRSSAPWVFIVALAVALVGLACFGYFTLKKTNLQLTQLFGNQAALNTLGQRVNTAESKLLDVTGRWEGLAQGVTMLESKVNRNVQQTRKYAEGLTEQLHQQVRAELEAGTSVLDARLRQVESEQTAQRSQLARVEGELRQQIASAREETGRDLSGVHQQVDNNARNLDSLSQQLDRERVDFEVVRGRTTELVPGVSLQISGTNNQYQRFRGSLWLLQDRRTLWLRDESVHQPVRFYHKEGGEPYELVVTDVTQHSVIGYLLVPDGQRAAVTALPHNGEPASSTSGND
jgi:septation ring formation regulator EzrA